MRRNSGGMVKGAAIDREMVYRGKIMLCFNSWYFTKNQGSVFTFRIFQNHLIWQKNYVKNMTSANTKPINIKAFWIMYKSAIKQTVKSSCK